MERSFFQDLWDAFELARHRYVYLIGGGGKTSAMYALAQAALLQSRDVLTSTSTRIFAPPHGLYLVPTQAALLELLRARQGHTTAAARRVNTLQSALDEVEPWAQIGPGEGKTKVQGFCLESLDAVYSQWSGHVLIEADGSAGRSLKAHAAWEPVVSPCAELVVLVVGADVLGAALDERWVHRSALFAELHGLQLGQTLDAEQIAAALCSPAGYLRELPKTAALTFLVSKAGAFRAQAEQLGQALLRHGLGTVLLAELLRAI
ncbi:MAG: selenium cofactor biosynthesis protein YqeC, partial [Myxococcota bacterium]|nr:selenium cofactor biosynthesis protein YqeC [Myxococcota bacterium]